jgi:hypothetical protein
VVAQAPLRVDGGRDGVASTCEREEERVALRVDLASARAAERVADDPPVVAGDDPVAVVAELLQQPRRALDVGERKRHRACVQVAHQRKRSSGGSAVTAPAP